MTAQHGVKPFTLYMHLLRSTMVRTYDKTVYKIDPTASGYQRAVNASLSSLFDTCNLTPSSYRLNRSHLRSDGFGALSRWILFAHKKTRPTDPNNSESSSGNRERSLMRSRSTKERRSSRKLKVKK